MHASTFTCFLLGHICVHITFIHISKIFSDFRWQTKITALLQKLQCNFNLLAGFTLPVRRLSLGVDELKW